MAKKNSALSISKLRKTFKQVIVPKDTDYDKARTVVAGDINRHPAIIIKVTNTNKVAQVISLAKETGLELAVRSGGHSICIADEPRGKSCDSTYHSNNCI